MIRKINKNLIWRLLLGSAGIALIFLMRFGVSDWQPRIFNGRLALDFGNGQKRMFIGPADGKTSILLALYSSSRQGRFELKYFMDSVENTKIQSIGDKVNYRGKVWHFYLNQQKISDADLDRIIIRRGDLIEAKFE